MRQFKFKKNSEKPLREKFIEPGLYSAVITQVADIGLQMPFDRENDPEQQMAVTFELANGDQLAKRMKFSEHPSSGCYAVFTAAFPDLEVSSDQELGLTDLLGKSALIEVEVRDGKWPRITGVLPLEVGFEAHIPTGELLAFDADTMHREVYLKLHRDIRSWIAKRVRNA